MDAIAEDTVSDIVAMEKKVLAENLNSVWVWWFWKVTVCWKGGIMVELAVRIKNEKFSNISLDDYSAFTQAKLVLITTKYSLGDVVYVMN